MLRCASWAPGASIWGFCCSSPQNDDTGVTEFSTTDEVMPFHVLTQEKPDAPSTMENQVVPARVSTPRVQKASVVQVPAVAPRGQRTPFLQVPAASSTLLGHPMNQTGSPGRAKADTPCSRKAARSEGSRSPVASAAESPGGSSPFNGAREHKERLQDMVTEFVRKAMRGCPCVYLVEGPAGDIERFPARYFVDTSLSSLSVESTAAGRKDLAQCTMASMQDIVHVAKDGTACFGPRMARALGPDEAELVLMIVHSDAEDIGLSIHLLLPSREEVDMFLECVQILSIYAKSQDGDT